MKKALSALLAITLLLTLAACGAAEPEPAVEATTEVTTQATTEATTEATAEATEPTVSEAERLYGLGMEALESGDADAAYEYFEAARAHDETSPSGWLGLAELLIRDYDFEGAESLLTEALEKTGNDPSVAEKLEMLHSDSIEDSSGKVLRLNGFENNGDLRFYQIFTYRLDGMMESVTSYDSAGNQTGHVQLEYDDQGREIVGISMNSGTGQVRRREIDYDDAGNVVEERYYTPEGTLDSKFVNYYNEQDQMIRQDNYEGTVLDGINHYTYNSLGQLERIEYCDAGDVLERYRIYSYNDAGKCVERCTYYHDGTLFQREVITYDENGKTLKQEFFDADGNLTRVYEYE